MVVIETRPCEFCGAPVTKSKAQQSQRKYWTCGRVCANKRRIVLGNTPGWGENPYRGQKETRPCAVCGALVTRYLTPLTIGQEWRCSRRCSNRAMVTALQSAGTWKRPQKPRKGDTVSCIVCGTAFYRSPQLIRRNARLCSTRCNAVYQTKPAIPKTCAYCGAPFDVKPSQAARRYCSKACDTAQKTKRLTGRMHNGRPVLENAQGYLTIYEPTHPRASRNGRVLEHRWVMEQLLGRYLSTDEHVDHINQDKTENGPENLQVLDPNAHSRKTGEDRRRKAAAIQQRLTDAERRASEDAAEIAALRAQLAALEPD